MAVSAPQIETALSPAPSLVLHYTRGDRPTSTRHSGGNPLWLCWWGSLPAIQTNVVRTRAFRWSALVRNLLEGQYENPVRIVAFNTAVGWSRDVTLDIADELRRSYPEFDEVPALVLRFLETTNRH